MRFSTSIPAALIFAAAASGAFAQDGDPIEFAGGTFTITEQADGEKTLTFDGRELTRAYVVFFDDIVEVGGTEVALFTVGDGGNACGGNTLIVWKPEGGAMQTASPADDCSAPPASVSPYSISFVPYLLPGESRPLETWSPDAGLKLAGMLAFVPQPGTGWRDVTVPSHIMDAFANAAVYDAALALLGKDLTEFARGLSVGGTPETLGPDLFHSRGCVPHACGMADSFMAVDRKSRKVYLAQQDDGRVRSWPDARGWPRNVRDAMNAALGR